MIVLIGAEAIARNVFGTSLQITDEVGGYLLVAHDVSQHVGRRGPWRLSPGRIGPGRLSRKARMISQIVFDLMSLAASAPGELAIDRGSRSIPGAPKTSRRRRLQTPLWLPQASMGIGMVLLCLALLRTIAAKVKVLRGGNSK